MTPLPPPWRGSYRPLLYRSRYHGWYYTLGPALRIADVKNMGKDLALEELRISPRDPWEPLHTPHALHQSDRLHGRHWLHRRSTRWRRPAPPACRWARRAARRGCARPCRGRRAWPRGWCPPRFVHTQSSKPATCNAVYCNREKDKYPVFFRIRRFGIFW